jgi:2-oxoglutarate ferredoxin oxidoreductase subunit alpha
MLKLVTVWPFPEETIRQISQRVKAFVVPEINYGQIALEVERCAGGAADTILVPNMGGSAHRPETIIDAIRGAIR